MFSPEDSSAGYEEGWETRSDDDASKAPELDGPRENVLRYFAQCGYEKTRMSFMDLKSPWGMAEVHYPDMVEERLRAIGKWFVNALAIVAATSAVWVFQRPGAVEPEKTLEAIPTDVGTNDSLPLPENANTITYNFDNR